MTSSKFSSEPRVTGSYTADCPVPGHDQYKVTRVEQFDGDWKQTGCPRCQWESLNLQCETITKYRRGVPGKAKRYFYVNEKKSPIFDTLPALLDAYPLIRQLAEVTYPPNISGEPCSAPDSNKHK